ncbi:hypothetical protein GCM10027181_03050 [Rheinheimera gaetbuli]
MPKGHAASDEFNFYTEHLPPYSYIEQDKLTGLNVELIRALCQRIQLSCNLQLLPWRRAFDMALHNPNSGVFSTSRSAEREMRFQWVGPIVSEAGY